MIFKSYVLIIYLVLLGNILITISWRNAMHRVIKVPQYMSNLRTPLTDNIPAKCCQTMDIDRTASSTKSMIFIDGTWLYYSLFYNKDRGKENNVLTRRLGLDWYKYYRFYPERILSLIVDQLQSLLMTKGVLRGNIEVVKSFVFSSTKNDTIVGDRRDAFLNLFKNNPSFDLQLYESRAGEEQEKCVDVAMAVEMVFWSTIPNIFDVVVMVGGDKDFIPALEKVRMLGKKVAICSIKNSFNKDLLQSCDFDVVWMDDWLNDLFVAHRLHNSPIAISDANVLSKVLKIIHNNKSTSATLNCLITSKYLDTLLMMKDVESDLSLVELITLKFGSVKRFLLKYPQFFDIISDHEGSWGFNVDLNYLAISQHLKKLSTSLVENHHRKTRGANEEYLLNTLLHTFAALPGPVYEINGKDLNTALSSHLTSSGINCLELMKTVSSSVRLFLQRYPNIFELGAINSTPFGFEYNVTAKKITVEDYKRKLVGSQNSLLERR